MVKKSAFPPYEPIMKWVEIPPSPELRAHCPSARVFRAKADDGARITATVERTTEYGKRNDGKPLMILRVSCSRRYPSWDEQKDARYALCEDAKVMAEYLPPRENYLSIYPNCFWFYEVVDPENNVPFVFKPRMVITEREVNQETCSGTGICGACQLAATDECDG